MTLFETVGHYRPLKEIREMVIYISETTTDHINTNMVRHSSIKSKYVAVVDEIFVETYHILA